MMKSAILPLFLCLLLSCQNIDQTPRGVKDTAAIPDTKGDIGALAKKTEKPASAWQYSDDEDKMTSKKIHYATLDALDELQLKFPYNGGVTVSIMVRRRDGNNNVLLQLSKGQFMPSTDGEQIRVRFDDNKAETYSCSGSADADSRYLFVDAASRFIAKLKKSKNVVIEATLFDNGLQQMEFSSSGLIWDK